MHPMSEVAQLHQDAQEVSKMLIIDPPNGEVIDMHLVPELVQSQGDAQEISGMEHRNDRMHQMGEQVKCLFYSNQPPLVHGSGCQHLLRLGYILAPCSISQVRCIFSCSSEPELEDALEQSSKEEKKEWVLRYLLQPQTRSGHYPE